MYLVTSENKGKTNGFTVPMPVRATQREEQTLQLPSFGLHGHDAFQNAPMCSDRSDNLQKRTPLHA